MEVILNGLLYALSEAPFVLRLLKGTSGSGLNVHLAQVLSKRCNPAHAKTRYNFFFKVNSAEINIGVIFFLHVYFDDMTIRVIFMVK